MQCKLTFAILNIVIILQCAIVCGLTTELDGRNLSRQKRFLLFPEGINYIQLIIGVGIPVELETSAVVFGWAFRAIYNMPSNLSQLMPMDVNTRKKRSISRWNIYNMLEQESEMRGFGGRPCILRSICEASDVPIDKNHGFFEELVHSLFTPSTTNEEVYHHTDNEYYAAQNLGRKYKGKCKQLFPECKHTFFDAFTRSDLDF